MKPRGRFIAGASCPACKAMDRLQMDVETGLRRWCVVCDFDETLADAPAGTSPTAMPSAGVIEVVQIGGGKG